MRPPSLHTLTGCVILSLAAVANSQAQSSAESPRAVGSSVWPAGLLPVGKEGEIGKITLGITAKEALDLANQFNPNNEKARLLTLKHVTSELGTSKKEVDHFYLGEFPVTNEQYLRYVKATGERFPYHWWKYGQPEHYNSIEIIDRVREVFPDLPANIRAQARLFFWEDFWKSEKLPYAIPAGEEKHPVIFVSWEDALRYAGWAGMRLPEEAEWMYAAMGDKPQEFVFGGKWDPKWLEAMKLVNMRDIKIRPVGDLGQAAMGPFGHQDMTGQVWEWVLDSGYSHQSDRKSFEREYNRLRRDKLGNRLDITPNFRDTDRLIKGGSYFSVSNSTFVELRIGFRAPLVREQTVEGVGFRVAKSSRPAFDMSLARLRSDKPNYLPENKDLDEMLQVGIENYDLDDTGRLINAYDAVSFIPANFVWSGKKKVRLDLVKEDAKKEPLFLGVLITTKPLAEPEVPEGIYGVYLREGGITTDLRAALRQAHNDLTLEKKLADAAAARAAKSGKAVTPTEVKEHKWEPEIRRYGYTNEELLALSADDLAKYVYVRHNVVPEGQDNRFKISTEGSKLMFRVGEGTWTGVIDTDAKFAKFAAQEPSTVTKAEDGAGLTFSFSIPKDQEEMRKENRRSGVPLAIKVILKDAWKN